MKKQINPNAAFFILMIGIFSTALSVRQTFGQTKETIKYNAVYDCGEGKIKFKVLSCDGKGSDAECTVFNINPYSPGGGHTGKMGRSTIESNFVGVCAVAGGEDQPPAGNNAGNATPDKNTGRNAAANDDSVLNNGPYKVGDRVQVTITGQKIESNYQPCTIIRDLKYNSYGVGCDPWHGQPYMEYSVEPSWVRAWADASATPNIPIDKLRVDGNDTVLADRELLDCESLSHNGRNGSPPPSELAKKLIRCLYERTSPDGQDGATTMDITGFTVGAPHRWNLNEDMGQGNASTLVYPVHVKWNMKTFYRTRNVQVTDKEMMFTCFVDTANLWQCGSAAGPRKEGKTQEIVVKKQ